MNILDGVITNKIMNLKEPQSPVQWEYRNKMEFSFGDEYKDGPLAIGIT